MCATVDQEYLKLQVSEEGVLTRNPTSLWSTKPLHTLHRDGKDSQGGHSVSVGEAAGSELRKRKSCRFCG